MTFEQVILLSGFLLNALISAGTLFKVIWGGATSYHEQFSALDKVCSASISALRNELLAKIDSQSSTIGIVVQNIGNRIHDAELKAAEARATTAENLSKITTTLREEFRRDTREESKQIRDEMQASFARLEAHVDNMSETLARGVLGIAGNPN